MAAPRTFSHLTTGKVISTLNIKKLKLVTKEEDLPCSDHVDR